MLGPCGPRQTEPCGGARFLVLTQPPHFQHPEVGSMCLNFEVMAIFRTDGQRLVTYQAPPGTPDHDAMLLLDMASPAEAAIEEAEGEPGGRHG
ncbi:hypothetical protein ACFQ7F_23980 [Streptomyces sp. NPDC056486]|uniref:MmyB family transcriptional regulator n=1 Tax=Streptomyces sp. NPDC056486 TaxID=3345835 RepID=UPI003697D4B3